MNGSQTRISGVDFGLKLSDDDNFRWFFETELVSEWVEQQYRVDADSIIQDNVPLVPLEEGEIEDPSQPREFVQERTILLPILTCFRVSQDPLVYNVHAFGDITSTESQFGFDPNLLSGEIVGPEVPASLVPPSWYFFEQYIRPLTFKPNCEFDPDATEIGEPFPETHGNYSVLPDWERGYLIGQRFGNGAQDPPSYFGEIETYPSTYCKRNATDNKLTGARDTDFDFITTGQVTEREEEATWRMWDEDRELTKNAPPQTAFWVPFALGSPFKQIAMRGQYDIDDKRPEPPECT
jgi:hypothetical protein